MGGGVSLQLPASVPVIASADKAGKILVHRHGQPPQELQHHTTEVKSVCFNPANSNVLASASEDKTAVVWDLRNNNKVKTMQYSSSAKSVAFSSGGEFLAVNCNDSNTYVYNAAAGYERVCVFRGTFAITSVAFHPRDPSLCLTASWNNVSVWQVGPQPKCIKVLGGHTGGVASACWLPDGEHVVSGSGDKTVRLWNVEATLEGPSDCVPMGKEVAKLEGHRDRVYSVAASPHGSMIASGSYDDTCRIWEAKSGEVLHVLKHPNEVRAVTFSGNGHVVTGCDDKKTRVWSVADGKVVAELGGHTDSVWCVAVPPMGAGAAAAASSSQPTSKPAATAAQQHVNADAGCQQCAQKEAENLRLKQEQQRLKQQHQQNETEISQLKQETAHLKKQLQQKDAEGGGGAAAAEATGTPSTFPAWMQQLPAKITDATKGMFVKEEIDEDVFVAMEDGDFQQLGVPFGQRKTLVAEIARPQQQ